jgi:UDPglucose 6-dehydrogenase
MHRIAVVGSGYVGLVTGASLAELGNRVVCIDSDATRVAALCRGDLPFHEPGLRELVLRNQHRGRLRFSTSTADGVAGCAFVFIAVGTPMSADGSCDLSALRAATLEIARHIEPDAILVNKSTAPVGTGDLIAALVREHRGDADGVRVVANPEFLREGSAVADVQSPDRIVIGAQEAGAVARMRGLYASIDAPVIVTDRRTAEMIKYTANAFLATKISFINEIADLCERLGADVTAVAAGAAADRRIGSAAFNAGLGFGGSCFPKDVSSLIDVAARCGAPSRLLPAVLAINRDRVERVVQNLIAATGDLRGARVGVLGLAFKGDTDDVRESPALAAIERLLCAGATVIAHDPVAVANARRALGERVTFAEDPYEAANGADALLIATDWAPYRALDFAVVKKRMRGAVVVDARNVCDPAVVSAAGLRYVGVGRARRATPPRTQPARPLSTPLYGKAFFH